jgi:hypothetical protein
LSAALSPRSLARGLAPTASSPARKRHVVPSTPGTTTTAPPVRLLRTEYQLSAPLVAVLFDVDADALHVLQNPPRGTNVRVTRSRRTLPALLRCLPGQLHARAPGLVGARKCQTPHLPPAAPPATRRLEKAPAAAPGALALPPQGGQTPRRGQPREAGLMHPAMPRGLGLATRSQATSSSSAFSSPPWPHPMAGLPATSATPPRCFASWPAP